jgi:outer membrane receptor for ferrienterochelin and colicins
LDRSASDRDDGANERDLTEHTARLVWIPVPDQGLYLQYGETKLSRTTIGGRGNTIREDERKTLSFGYEGLIGGWDTTILLAREDAKRETPTSTLGRAPELATTTLDAKASRSFDWYGVHRFTVGGQYLKADLIDLNVGLGDGLTYAFSNRQMAVFAEDLWEITDRFELTLGLRYTDDERFGGKFTPRVYALYELSPGFYLSGGIATGYKTPEIRDANDTYFLPTGGRGSNDLIQGNPDLQPEESTSYELGLRFENDRFSAAATLYQTDFTNKIETFDTGTQIVLGGVTYDLFTYGNVERVRNQGLELNASYDITDDLALSGSFTFTDSEQLSGDLAGQPLTRTPKHQASLRLDWQTPQDGLKVWAEARYMGEAINATSSSGGVDVTELDSYATLDIGVNYALNDNVTLRGAIYNVADAQINSDEHGTTRNGRTLWVSVTTEF